MYVCAALYPMSLPLSLELSEDSVRSLMRVVFFFHVPTEARNDATLPASVESFFFHPFSKDLVNSCARINLSTVIVCHESIQTFLNERRRSNDCRSRIGGGV